MLYTSTYPISITLPTYAHTHLLPTRYPGLRCLHITYRLCGDPLSSSTHIPVYPAARIVDIAQKQKRCLAELELILLAAACCCWLSSAAYYARARARPIRCCPGATQSACAYPLPVRVRVLVRVLSQGPPPTSTEPLLLVYLLT